MSLRTGRFNLYYRTKIQAQKRFDFMEQTVEEAKNLRTARQAWHKACLSGNVMIRV
jgi:hypothetical protein